MSTREQTLAIVLLGLILLVGGGAGGYLLVYEPVRQKNAAAARLEQENEELRAKVDRSLADAKRLAVAKRRSLPADENLAKREYAEMLSRLLRRANIPPGTKPEVVERGGNATAAGTPLLAAKKPAYTKVVYEVTFEKADMWAVQDFLRGYYSLNLLHQITAVSIKKDDDAASGRAKAATPTDRKDLTVKLTTEAIILDGAENRRTLLPVSSAFAAVGGWGGYSAVARVPEIARGIAPAQLVPVLSPRNRDYSLLVLKDMFHGPPPPPSPLQLGKIADVAVEVEKPIPPVKVPVNGDPGFVGKVTLAASAEGKLLPDGAVTVDQAARTVTLLPVAGETGTAKVTVVAQAENGQEAKTTFSLSVKDPPESETPRPKDDISQAVTLIAVTTRNDGTASATVRDSANRFKYEVEASPRRVKVTRFYHVGDQKKKDPDYDTPDELVIADDWSLTSRRFKVVAVDDEGLILSDLKPEAKPAAPKAGKGGPRAAGDGPAHPLSVVVGLAAAGQPSQPAQPTLYRWASGKSLKGLTEVPKDEAAKILRRAAEIGPVGATASAATPPPIEN